MELFTNWHSWNVAERGLRDALTRSTGAAADVTVADLVADAGSAVSFATAYHRDQRRPTGAPYLEHLLEALEVLARGAQITDRDVLRAAVLHDVVEDTLCTTADLREAFGPRVAELVGWVTIPEAGPGGDKAEVKEAYLRGLAGAPRDAILVKLADRASNVQTLRNLPVERQRGYFAQTVRYIVPLATTHAWFGAWYADWQHDFADLAA
jgi:GTP pyrophosphokinase